MKLRILAATTISLAALAAAGCGSSAKLESDDIAVTCGQHVTKDDWSQILNQEKAQLHGKLPKVGTTQYADMKNQLVGVLVQTAALKYKAKKLGLKVTDDEVNKQLQQIVAGQYHGKKSEFLKDLPKLGLTYPQAFEIIRFGVLKNKLQTKIESDVKVSDDEAKAYFEAHKDQYASPEQRQVAHILVKTKAEALKLEARLKAGADFAALARKYSKDPGSAAAGGVLTATNNANIVKPFREAAFALKTGQISQPVQSSFGWHIIKALGAVQPAQKPDFNRSKDAIKSVLLQKRGPAAVTKWVNEVKKDCVEKTKYAAGYTPPTQTTPATPGVTKTS
jgi:foldase protein PrsA